MFTDMTAQIINGKQIADELCAKLKKDVEHLSTNNRFMPGLAVLLIGDDPASTIYVQNKIKKAQEVGINIFEHIIPATISQRILKAKIENLNNDLRVHGILVQLPLPKPLEINEILDVITPDKDVDGFTVRNVGLLHSNRDCIEPSTPKGVMILIKNVLGNDLSGKKAVVIGRSLIVGRPMASMLLREDCTVTIVHSKSHNIIEECKSADILISAVGEPEFIDEKYIKPGACVIDVGITRVDGKIKGDLNFASVSQVAGFITPVPGGVGPMTVACMLENTVKAACKIKGIKLAA